MQKYQKERHFKTAYTCVVLTKPQYVAVIDGNLMYNKEGSYVFLGILQIFRQNIKKDRHKK